MRKPLPFRKTFCTYVKRVRLACYFTTLLIFSFVSSTAQSFNGTVLDKETSSPLPYASVGVKGKSIGGIADRWGKFTIDVSNAAASDSIIISYTGYDDVKLVLKNVGLNSLKEIRLQPKAKELPEVIIVPKKDLLSLGNTGHRARFTGWGDYHSSRGRLRGMRIESKEFPLRITEFAVRFKDVEFDSVKLRLHIQTYQPDGAPGKDLLNQTVFFTAVKNQNWVYVDLIDQNIVIAMPVIVSVEGVDAWTPQEKKDNGAYLFTFSLDKKKGYVYQRNTPQERYSVNFKNETPTMYLKGIKIKRSK